MIDSRTGYLVYRRGFEQIGYVEFTKISGDAELTLPGVNVNPLILKMQHSMSCQ